MGAKSAIEWTDSTWNPVTGCTKISPGCRHCSAERMARRLQAMGPYEKLKRALRSEVDESAWTSLYSTRSSPFDPPSTGRIAIKVIKQYGDEVLKVYESESEEALRKV